MNKHVGSDFNRDEKIKEIIFTDKAPLPLGTYSQAVRAGSTIYLSAQTPVSPTTGQVEATDFEGQMRQTMDNLKVMAAAAGGTLDDVVKVMVFIANIDDFSKMNNIMEEYFVKPYPHEQQPVQMVSLVEHLLPSMRRWWFDSLRAAYGFS